MIDKKKTNRLFIGASVVTNWPDVFPDNDVIKEENRHVTICFFGEQKSELTDVLMSFPQPNKKLSPVGYFVEYVGIPRKNPRLVALEGELIDEINMIDYREEIIKWAIKNKIDFKNDKRDFYPHVTISRRGFEISKWIEKDVNIPFYLDGVHLYESFGSSEYKKLKSYLFTPIFEQVQHTADIAFYIRGLTLQNLYINAQIALSFSYPEFLNFLDLETKIETSQQIVTKLNSIVSNVDIEVGCPFKAVSFHGSFVLKDQGYTEWEMIVDV